MAVVNLTPDSFSGNGLGADPGRALEFALAAEAAGADILDLGAESTRPGAAPIDADEELGRLLPALRRIVRESRLPISIDTTKAVVASVALDEGAAIVNDISGLRYDPGLGAVVAAAGAGLVVMHMRGRPADMYRHAVYADPVAEVCRELADSVAAAEAAGVAREAIVVDPGLGFAKRTDDSYALLGRLAEFAALDRPILVGSSRTSFLARALGDLPPQARDWGTAASVAAAIVEGAHIVRVHAAAEMVQVARVADEILKGATRA
jgi:dihydropteroate synthase